MKGSILLSSLIFMNVTNAFADDGPSCPPPNALSHNTEQTVNALINPPVADPKQQSCYFKKQAASHLLVNMSGVKSFLANAPVVPSAQDQSCLGEHTKNETVGSAELTWRNSLCKQYADGKPGLDEKNYIRKTAADLAKTNLDIFKDTEKSTVVETQIKDRASEWAKNTNCPYGVTVSYQIISAAENDSAGNFSPFPYSPLSKTAVQSLQTNKDMLASRKKELSDYLEKQKSIAKLFCTGPIVLEPRKTYSRPNTTTIPYGFGFGETEGRVDPDKTPENSNKLKSYVADLQQKIKENLACGNKFLGFRVIASSSKIANSESSKYPTWDMTQLSIARGEQFKKSILEQVASVVPANAPEMATWKKLVQTKVDPINGNGADGPCPYTLDPNGNGHSVIYKKGYEPGGTLRSTLQDAQNVNIEADFSGTGCGTAKTDPNDGLYTQTVMASQCMTPVFACAGSAPAN